MARPAAGRPQHCPTPAGAGRPRAAPRRGARARSPASTSGITGHARPPAPSWPGPDGRAGRPRGAAAGPASPPDGAVEPLDPRAYGAVPAAAPVARRSVRERTPGAHVRRRSPTRSTDETDRATWPAHERAGRCSWRWSATAPPELSPVGPGARRAAPRRARLLDEPTSSPSRWPATATPRLDHALGQCRSSRRTPPADRSLGLPAPTPTTSCPATSPRSSTPTGPPPERAGPGGLLHRPVRQRQVDAGPGPASTCCSRTASRTVTSLDGDVVRRHLSAGPDLLPRGPGDQHPAHRLGGRRDRPAPRHRHLLPDRAVRRDPPAGARDGRGRRRRASSWCTSPPRSRSASDATARASTPRPGAARSPSSPASPAPYEEPTTPTCASTPPAARSRTCLDEVLDALPGHLTSPPDPVGRGPSTPRRSRTSTPRRSRHESRSTVSSRPDRRWSSVPRRNLTRSTKLAQTPHAAESGGALRLHRQHLPLAVPRAALPPAAGPTRRRGQQRRDPRVRRAARPTPWRTVFAAGHRPAAFRSRPVTGDLLDDADLVLTAEAAHRTGFLDDRPAAFRKVFTLGQFAGESPGRGPHLHGLALLRSARTAGCPRLARPHVADPYRRGPEAARRAPIPTRRDAWSSSAALRQHPSPLDESRHRRCPSSLLGEDRAHERPVHR